MLGVGMRLQNWVPLVMATATHGRVHSMLLSGHLCVTMVTLPPTACLTCTPLHLHSLAQRVALMALMAQVVPCISSRLQRCQRMRLMLLVVPQRLHLSLALPMLLKLQALLLSHLLRLLRFSRPLKLPELSGGCLWSGLLSLPTSAP